ncbi:XkdW family protein [Paenibacillus sp. FSL P2-0136]|uniref:XkdW family protein n=1 Tax=Paenibacillus sp. FSL P2-0136 TaxID=2975317 RepID=UPI0030DA0901
MNIALSIMHLYPTAVSLHDFIVQDNGPEPVLRPGAETKGRVRYEIKPPEIDEQPVEGINYRHGIDYNLLTEGEDYDLVERGPYIAVWNLDAPQPTEAELQAAWEAYQEAEANKPPVLTELEQLQQENLWLKAQNNALSERADFIEDLIAEMATQVYT